MADGSEVGMVNGCKKVFRAWAQWLMSVVPGLWEAEAGELVWPRSSRLAWATWINLVSTEKKKKIARHGGT